MGCWNQTCGLTHVPILSNEPVKVLLLRQNPYPSRPGPGGPVYPTDLWQPLGPVLTGTYDDYGRAQDIQADAAAQCALDYFQEHHPDEFQDTTLPDIVLTLSEDRDLTYQGREAPLSYGYMMIPTPIYEDFIAAVGGSTSAWYLHGTEETAREHVAAQVGAYAAKRRARSVKTGEDGALATALASLRDLDVPLGESLRSVVQRKWLMEHLGEEPELESTVTDLLLFLGGVADTRRTLMPQCGQGSQETALGLHYALARATRDHLKRQKAYLRG